jgi:hypothetical protein
MTRVGPAPSDVITTDMVHLSDAGSKFLIGRIRRSLFPQSDFYRMPMQVNAERTAEVYRREINNSKI